MEEIFVPASGMAMEDVLFTEWLKQPGDLVAAGEPVAVVETDKSVVELSGTTAGVLSHHLVNAGDRVPGGATVAYLLQDGEDEPGDGEKAGTAQIVGRPADGDAPPVQVKPSTERDPLDGATGQAEKRSDGRHTLSPRQRREAMQQQAGPPVVPSGPPPPDAELRWRNREATAKIVSESWRTMPHFSVGRDVRADGLDHAVQAARSAGGHVTVTDLLVLALSRALGDRGESTDVGLAVATDWGVLIPVLRGLDGASLQRVALLRQAAVDRARQRRLDSSDTAPAFATLSNLGPEEVTWFTGVVPLSHVVLLTVGEVGLRPAVEGRGLVVAPMFTAVMTADHRHYDGVDSARLLGAFTARLREVIGGAGS